MNGRIYLIPVTLGGDDFHKVIPEKVIGITRQLRFFIVEDVRSARRFLRLIDKEFPINDSIFFELNEHTGDTDIAHYLEPIWNGSDIGVLSEAGLPGIADPGARIIALAHKKRIAVKPLTGPSWADKVCHKEKTTYVLTVVLPDGSTASDDVTREGP
jgi:16S rRNA (cytidine1402-2'-O)-methyltransferase